MITVTRVVGMVTEEHCFENITDYAMYLLMTGEISPENFHKFLAQVVMTGSYL